jgi:hypothetical protein
MEKHLRHLPKLKKGDKCLNCGHTLTEDDNFCPRCGQINDTKRISFLDMIREILGDFFAYDSRLANSIIPLVKKPGQLALDYIAGKRASHIHPIRLLLLISFVFFLLSSLNVWKEKVLDEKERNNTEQVTTSGTDTTDTVNNAADNSSATSDEYEISLNFSDDDEIENENDLKTVPVNDLLDIKSSIITDSLILEAHTSKLQFLRLALANFLKDENATYEDFLKKFNIEDTSANRIVFNKAKEYSATTMRDFYKTLSKRLPFLTFLFLPFFAIFLNIINSRKDIYYFEHLVFAFYQQSTYFLLAIIAKITSLFWITLGDIISYIMILFFAIHLYKALKTFYNYKTRAATIGMYVLINSVFVVFAIGFFTLSIFITFFL